MFQPHSKDANTIYGPDWMLSALEKDVDRCHVKPVELPPCTALTLQPHNEEDVEDMELLQLALERYSSISPGQELILWHPYGYPFVVRVSAAEPDHPWVSIAYADIPLTMEPPLVSTVVPVAATEAVATEAVATEAVATEAVATVAAATATATATNLRQQCFEAARRRMEAKEKSE
jgi:hypothetical protein